MSTNRELKRYNIEPIRALTSEEVEQIAVEVIKKIEAIIVDFDGKYMYEHIVNSKMYFAKIPEKYTDVNYIVTTNSIYIREHKNIKDIDEIMLHEIFHYIQCNEENNIGSLPEQMGLCKLHGYKITGLAINEVAIQLIISIVFGQKQEYTNYFGIDVDGIQNKSFPILCALLQQITYVLGYKELLKSILENTDDFKEAFEDFAGKKSYDFLRNSFDKMMNARDKIAEDRRILKVETNYKKRKLIEKKIEIRTKEIQDYFLAVQKLCYTEYFKPKFKNVKSKEELKCLKEEIAKYHKHIGKVGEKDEFVIYTQKQMQKLNNKFK